MTSKNINLQDVIKRDLYNKFGDFIGDIKKKINNDLTEEEKKRLLKRWLKSKRMCKYLNSRKI